MPHMMDMLKRAAIAASVAGALAVAPASAQDIRRFDSMMLLQSEIAGHMGAGQFANLVEAVAPPGRMSTGRIRILETAGQGNLVPQFTENTTLFRDEPSEGMVREVTAWWSDDTYLYLGLLTHEREDRVLVLDFLLTSNVTRASRWYLTGTTQ